MVKNAVHIHVNSIGVLVMILVDEIYEEYFYADWSEVFLAHPIMLSTGQKDIHIFVR